MDQEMVCVIATEICDIKANNNDRTVVYLSGGEPLLHPQFFEILNELYRDGNIDKINILTNGLLISDNLHRLKAYSPKVGVQISVDGSRQINDSIRGPGVYDRASQALRELQEAGIPHWIGYTVSNINRACFPDILELALQTDSNHNNITPYTGDPSLMLSYTEWKEFKYRLRKHARQIGLNNPNGPNSCGFVYGCGAYISGLTINPDGTATGCARDNRAEGAYDELGRLVRKTAVSMHKSCMRGTWGSIERFSLLAKLE